MNYIESIFYQRLMKEIGEAKKRISETICLEVPRDEYLRLIGTLRGIDEVAAIAHTLKEEMSKE